MTKQSDVVHSYCEAVERSLDAHPIQRARDLQLGGAFATAGEFYAYTVCPFDSEGEALPPTAAVADVAWVIFDNVYSRGGKNRFPKNQVTRKARNAGFRPEGQPKGKGVPAYGPSRATELWIGTVSQWGLPPGFKESSAGSPYESGGTVGGVGTVSESAKAVPPALVEPVSPTVAVSHGATVGPDLCR